MLSSNVIGNYKFVLFVDNYGIEPNWKIILKKLLEEQNQIYKFYDEFEDCLEKSSIIISLSELELKSTDNVYENIFRKIQELKSSDNVLQIFGWICIKNVQNKILVPFLEHMSNLIVTINDSEHMTIVSKNKSGSMKSKDFIHELSLGKTSVQESKKENIQSIVLEMNVNNLGTFKIGQKADELAAKRNLKLPFEIIDLPNKTSEGKIIYTPDSTDDFDEEDDPDNDLQF
ncbi:unnamed protein product [Chironomus riparius]|uniref:Elongator complex protein 5 n=1 Tax=Chironomus riparius TaxID=315576 RepID=A0A9N9S1Y6_9DIPT|nr:unnamed protein product [Chironomus riparius]